MTHYVRDVGVAGSNPVTPTIDLIRFFPTDTLLGVSFNCRWVWIGCEFQAPFFVKFSDAT
jgi:hypothetical protein